MLSHSTVMIIDLIHTGFALLGKRVRVMVAGRDAFSTMDTFRLIPDQAAFQRMNLSACTVCHTSHGNILTSTSESAGSVTCNV